MVDNFLNPNYNALVCPGLEHGPLRVIANDSKRHVNPLHVQTLACCTNGMRSIRARCAVYQGTRRCRSCYRQSPFNFIHANHFSDVLIWKSPRYATD